MYRLTVIALLLGSLCIVVRDDHAQAVALTPSDGFIGMDRFSPAPFDDVRVLLNGPQFSLTNSFLTDSFHFFATPSPGATVLRPGTLADFSGEALLVAPSDRLTYAGVTYQASGRIGVSVAPVPVGGVVREPFTLTGTLHGVSLAGSQTIDVNLAGSGVLTASFLGFGPDRAELAGLRYDIVPEPASALLLGSGLLGLRWLTRRRRVG